MSLGLKLSTFAAALVLAGSAFAQDDTCPSINDLQAEGINMSQQISEALYVGYSISDYNTSSTWAFAIGPVQADSKEDAIDYSNDILSSMFSPGAPEDMDGQFACVYDTGTPDIFAVAVKGFAVSPMKLKQYLLKAH